MSRTIHSHIPEKANWILHLILIALLLIILRLWHLTVIQYDARVEEARKPQTKTFIEPAQRGTIHDRFDIPLAVNKIRYQAAILYSQIREIPSTVWTINSEGQRVKIFKRKEYIKSLSKILADELQLDPDRLEDLIHSKAAMYFNIPFVIKDELSESEYYRLKMLEKDWNGIHVQRLSKRTYPQGKVAGDIIGYLGAINKKEYEAIIGEIKSLEEFIQTVESGNEVVAIPGIDSLEEAHKRLQDLQDHAYTVNDYIGKLGIEAKFDRELRGFYGKKIFTSDAKGSFLELMPESKEPIPGKKINLTISSELQEYAEKLLIQNESLRKAYISRSGVPGGLPSKQPWMKGGAIIALDPNNGEILAMASYPRFNPNDFVSSNDSEKKANIIHWLESEEYLKQIWDQIRPLEKEVYDNHSDSFTEESLWMSWDNFLKIILPSDSSVVRALQHISTVKNAIQLQKTFEVLLKISEQENSYFLLDVLYGSEAPFTEIKNKISFRLKNSSEEVRKHKKALDTFLSDVPSNFDKVLVIDLCRLAVNSDTFSPDLAEKFPSQTLSSYRNISAAFSSLEPIVKDFCATLFHQHNFAEWRTTNEKAFLLEKRNEEKAQSKYAKPYIDYLDNKEKELFSLFWEQHRWSFLASFILGTQDGEEKLYLEPIAKWHQEVASGAYTEAAWFKSFATLQEFFSTLPKQHFQLYLATLRNFHSLTRPLLGKYKRLRNTNGKQLEKHLAASFYPLYGYGHCRSFAYRQACPQGSIFKLVTAYAALLQQYESNPNQSLNPLTIYETSQGQGKNAIIGHLEDGTSIPQFYKGGKLTKSTIKNLGRLDLQKAIENSSNPYFSLLAGDFLKDPEMLAEAAKSFSYGKKTGVNLRGEYAGKIPKDLSTNRTGLYSMAIGQHSLVVTPLQTAIMLSALANGGKILQPLIIKSLSEDIVKTKVEKELKIPSSIRKYLLDAMKMVIKKIHSATLSTLSQFYHPYPEAISDFIDLESQIVGKSGTAEALEQIDLDPKQGIDKYSHLWFGAISFDKTNPPSFYVSKDEYGNPELVVVIYLKYGRYGKDGSPLAAQMIQKWRDIKTANPPEL